MHLIDMLTNDQVYIGHKWEKKLKILVSYLVIREWIY